MEGLPERVKACASDLSSISKDVKELGERMNALRTLTFKAEILRARRHVKLAAERSREASALAQFGSAKPTQQETEAKQEGAAANTENDSSDSGDTGVDNLTSKLGALDVAAAPKEHERLERFKNRGRGRQASESRMQAMLDGLSELRFNRWSQERGVEVSPSKSSQLKVRAASIPGEQPKLPPLGDLRDSEEVGIVASDFTHPRSDMVTLEAVSRVRKVLSRPQQPPIDAVIETGVVPYLVHLLAHNSHRIQFEAAWALTNIASGSSRHTQAVLENNGVEFFAYLLRSPSEDVCDQAVWALGNISGDCVEYRDLCLQKGILPTLLNIIRSSQQRKVVRNAVWCVSNLCRGKPRPDFAVVRECIPIVSQCALSDDEEAATDALWALSYLTDGDNFRISAVLEALSVPGIVQHVTSNRNPSMVTPALRILGNIVSGDDIQTQVCLRAGLLPALKMLLTGQDTKRTLLKEACWALSNITAGTRDQIQEVIDHGFLPLAAEKMQHADMQVAKEAAWILSNITSGGNLAQLLQLLEPEVMQGFGRMLQGGPGNVGTVVVEALSNLYVAYKSAAEQGDERGEPAKDTLLTMMEDFDVLPTLSDMDDDRAARFVLRLEEDGVL